MEPKLQEFIDENRLELETAIRGAIQNPDFELDDDEIGLWILNNEGLYNWALMEGAIEE